MAQDEYYFITSVHLILEKGVPTFPQGGLYTRGLPLQYITAASIYAFGDNTFAYRLPSAIFSLLSVWIAYLLARRLLGRGPAATIAAILLLSSWQIEFARFARMYSAFQFITLLFIYSIPLIEVSRGLRRYIPHLVCGIALTTHQMAITLLPLLFFYEVAIALKKKRVAPGALIATSATIILAPILIFVPQFINVALTKASTQIEEPKNESFKPLHELIFSIDANNLFTVTIIVIVFLVLAWLIHTIYKNRTSDRLRSSLCVLFLAFCLIHQLSIAALIGFVLLFRFEIYKYRQLNSFDITVFAGGCITITTWALYALMNPSEFISVDKSFSQGTREIFFGWIDIYRWSISPILHTLPVLTVLFIVSLFTYARELAQKPLNQILKSPIWVVVSFWILLGIIHPPHLTTRYLYYLYPLLFIITSLSLKSILDAFPYKENVKHNLLSLLVLLGFAFSSDFFPAHLANPVKEDVSFRTGIFEKYDTHWYQRFDVRSVAEFASEQLPKEDLLIVYGREDNVFHYLERDFEVFYPSNAELYDWITYGGLGNHRWCLKPIISNSDEFLDRIEQAGHAWILKPTVLDNNPFDIKPRNLWPSRISAYDQVFLSSDGRMEVMKLSLFEQ